MGSVIHTILGVAAGFSGVAFILSIGYTAGYVRGMADYAEKLDNLFYED